MKLTVPFPPSNNSLWRAVKGRNIKSEAYRDWQTAAGHALNLQRLEPRHGRVRLVFVFSRPDKRKRGLDNYLKAPIDLLVAHGIIDDDEDSVAALAASWGDVDGLQINIWRA